MITLTNTNTNESINICNTHFRNNQIIGRYVFGERYYKKYTMLRQCGMLDETQPILEIVDPAWTLDTTSKRAKAEPKDEPKADTPKDETPKDEPKKKAEPKAEPNDNDADAETALIKALKALKGGAIDAEQVREIVRHEIEQLAQNDKNDTKIKLAIKSVKQSTEYFIAGFEQLCKSVAKGYAPYMYGAAGCGKSHTAEQIARALNLPFYAQTTIQFAHDVKGYGDASGRYQETPFYKAFAGGGVYFQDEYDRSNPEAAVVLNTALANKYYDFPVVGRVEMHPNFRFIAAGNTMMKGAQDGYVTGQEQDSSSRDRVFYFECTYNHDVELNAIAEGDAELVEYIEDVRAAIKACNIEHVVSYRATDYLHNNADIWGKAECLKQKVFAGLQVDEIREIYARLANKDNTWAKETKKLF